MKSKYLRNLSIALIVFVSCFSFVYLNFGLNKSTEEVQIIMDAEQDKSVEEDTILTELSLLKSVGKKLLEVVIFTI